MTQEEIVKKLDEEAELANIISAEVVQAMNKFADFVSEERTPEEWNAWYRSLQDEKKWLQ